MRLHQYYLKPFNTYSQINPIDRDDPFYDSDIRYHYSHHNPQFISALMNCLVVPPLPYFKYYSILRLDHHPDAVQLQPHNIDKAFDNYKSQ